MTHHLLEVDAEAVARMSPIEQQEVARRLWAIRRQIARNPLYGIVPHAKQLEYLAAQQMIVAFVGGNRCLPAGTLVRMADGSTKAIERIRPGEFVMGADRDGVTRPVAVVERFVNGEKPTVEYVFRRKTGDDVVVRCTPEHKLLVRRRVGRAGESVNETVPAGEITERHQLVRALGFEPAAPSDDLERWALLWGLLLGDGSFSPNIDGGGRTVTFHNQEDDLIDLCATEAHELGCSVREQDGSGGRRLVLGCNGTTPRGWLYDLLEQHGLDRKAHEKRIPACVFGWSNEAVGRLLAGLILTDGWVSGGKVGIQLTSPGMIEDVRALLEQRFGVYPSKVSRRRYPKGTQRDGYTLRITSRPGLRRLAAAVPLVGRKADALAGMTGEIPREKDSRFLRFQGARQMGVSQTYDLRVDHPDHLFLLANGAIVSNSGKTWGGALDDVIQILPEKWIPPWLMPYKRWFEPVDWRVGTVNERTTLNQVILPIYRKLIPREALLGGRWDRAYNADRRTLLLAEGSTVDFLTYQMDLDAWSGVAKHGIRLDEEPKGYAGRKIFEECMERLLSTDGDFRMTFTPLFGLSWSYHLLTAGGEPRDDEDIKVVRAHQDDNPHLSSKAKARANRLYSSEVRAARKAGLWIHFQGQVYPEWDVNVHVVPEHGPPIVTVGFDEFNKPIRRHAAVYVGIDPGRDHPLAVVWCYAHEGRLVVFDYRKRRGEGTDAKAVAEMIHSVNRGWGIKVTGYVIDPSAKRHTHETGTKSYQTLLAEHGIRARAGQNSKDAGFSRVAELLRDTPPPPVRPLDAPADWQPPDLTNVRRLQVTANCSSLDDPDMPGLVEEFPMYRWKEASTQAREVGSPGKPIDLKNDALDALRYVVMMNPRELLIPVEADEPPPTNPREIDEWRRRKMRRDDLKRKMAKRRMRRAGKVGSVW